MDSLLPGIQDAFLAHLSSRAASEGADLLIIPQFGDCLRDLWMERSDSRLQIHRGRIRPFRGSDSRSAVFVSRDVGHGSHRTSWDVSQ